MKILITGAAGFVGRNLCAELRNRGLAELLEFDVDTPPALLDEYAAHCDFVFHLAGVNRPKDPAEFMEGNFGFTSELLDALRRAGNKAPIVLSSSTQAELDNDYGRSKKAGEELLLDYGRAEGVRIVIYRFPNVFGKWCRPNYNSAVATFCHNIAHGLPIQVNDPSVMMLLVYIDDVVESLITQLTASLIGFAEVEPVHRVELGRIAELIQGFRESRTTLAVPDLGDAFVKKLYSTYLSYLPTDDFGYGLKMNVDERGSFTEFLKTPDRGQVSVNVARPGIAKGNHWHHTKNEKFLVVSGRGVIRFRRIDSEEVIEYFVSGDRLEVIDIPVGYTHNIENIGDTDLVTVMWVNEVFDPQRPDTFFLKV